MRCYYSETITGVSNTVVYGSGLSSTEAEPKRVLNVMVVVSARNGNMVEGWIERERILQVYDLLFPLQTDTFRLNLPIELEIPIGKTFNFAVRSGATATTLYVTYEYEVKE